MVFLQHFFHSEQHCFHPRTNQFEMFGEHENCLFHNEKNVVLNENSVEGKPCINRESKILEISFSYTDVMMNMKLLEVVHHRIFIMVAPLGRSSGRKRLQARKSCSQL